MAQKLQIFIADHNQLSQESFQTLVDFAPHMEILGVFSNAQATLAHVLSDDTAPHILLCSLNLPDMSPYEVVRRMKKKFTRIRVIFFASLGKKDYHEMQKKSIRAGGSGLLHKAQSAEDIYKAIKSVHAGFTYFPPQDMVFPAATTTPTALTAQKEPTTSASTSPAASQTVSQSQVS